MDLKPLENFYKTHPIKRIKIRGKVWEYIACGKGTETLLLFPGGGQTAQGNFRLIQAFEHHYKIIIPTIYDVDSIEAFCFAINTILQKEKIQNIILYGLSLGGLMALSYTKRNKEKVSALILSHCCTPKSKFYRRKVLPLLKLSFLLPFIPMSFFALFLKQFAKKLQRAPRQNKYMDDTTIAFTREFFETYFTKRLLTTWSNLHKDFLKETFSFQDFSDWNGKVLVLRSDTDPLMQDEGDFKTIFPHRREYVFHNTGHVAYYYAFPKMVDVMRKFLRNN